MTKTDMISVEHLRNYIENNEVVYQICDELIDVSNDDNNNNRQRLIEYFNCASGLEAFPKGNSLIRDSFEDIDNWSMQDDVLFFLKSADVVICIPRKLAVDNEIILA